MKIGIISDLHYNVWNNNKEVNKKFITPYKNKVDTMIFAGDIVMHNEFDNWCKTMSTKFKNIIVVLGNHDYWDIMYNRPSLQEVVRKNRRIAQKYDNIFMLQNDSIVLDDITFIGSTYFADLSKNNLFSSLFGLGHALTDFRYTDYEDEYNYDKREYRPSDITVQHKKAKEYIEEELEYSQDGKTVIITHFAPSKKSIAEQFKTGEASLLNDYFCNDDDQLIKKYTNKIPLWIHGHTHTFFDYKIAKTRVVCNPVGYPNELNDFTPLIVEI